MNLAFNLPLTQDNRAYPSPEQKAAAVNYIATPAAACKSSASGVTELVLTQHSQDEIMLLLPMLAHLTRVSDRWITWVAPNNIDRSLLAQFGIETQKLRLIHSSKVDDSKTKYCRWILWEALRAGTSHTVIASPGSLSEKALEYLDKAAKKGNSHGLLIHYR